MTEASTPPPVLRIEPLAPEGFDVFARYLAAHVAENGTPGTGWFQPLPHGTPLEPARLDAFRKGLSIAVGQPAWRRAWVARRLDGSIAGHVDLRARPEPYTLHRCLLGMGVDTGDRGRGLGRALLAHAIAWAGSTPGLDHLDLMVLANNTPALRLYETMAFTEMERITDHFRIDAQRLTSISMTRPLKAEPNPSERRRAT